MNQQTIISIAYIACRLIAGKKIISLHDVAGERNIEVKKILDAEFIADFDERHGKGLIRGRMYEYKPKGIEHPIEIFLDKRNFIIHIKGSTAYFIGNIQKNTICFYNHKEEMHFKYEIKKWTGEGEKPAPRHHAHASVLSSANAGLF